MKTAVVICPGRGTYNKSELGYLGRHHADRADLLESFEAIRRERGRETLQALDGAATYSLSRHSRGDNASALIFAATYCDFLSIARDEIEIVAVTGNSMGWYSALACAGALSPVDGFDVVDTMGALMQEALIGGQIVYPFTGEDWQADPARKRELLELIDQIGRRDGHVLALSIDLGGMLVIAGNEPGLSAFEKAVPPLQGRFPMRLGNHAAFHTALQAPVAEAGRARLAPDMFMQPALPLIDGRGAIWWPHAADTHAMWDYTFGHQVVEPYDFTRAVQIAAREFAPDLFIVTGPGTTLGGAVAQSLILADWHGIASKADFLASQQPDPFVVLMGMDDHRPGVLPKIG